MITGCIAQVNIPVTLPLWIPAFAGMTWGAVGMTVWCAGLMGVIDPVGVGGRRGGRLSRFCCRGVLVMMRLRRMRFIGGCLWR